MRALLPLLLLLSQALPARAGTASVYYFSHDYRITFDLAQTVEEIINSTAAIKPESSSTAITYTKGNRFLLEGPEALSAEELNRTTDYALESEVEVIAGGHSILLPPQDLLEKVFADIEYSVSAYFAVERLPAMIMTGLSPSGLKFRSLYIPSRTETVLWEPTIKMENRAVMDGRPLLFTGISIPMGLSGLPRKMIEDSADKTSGVLLSLGAGGQLAGVVLKTGPARTLDYMTAAGTDIAALEPDDLGNFWRWSRDGLLKLSSSTAELICSNLKVSDPELARFIKPYALRKIGGVTVAFISLIPSNSAILAGLAGSPFTVEDPKDEKALYTLINTLRGEHKAKIVVAVSFLHREELGWILGVRGIDALIGPKSWDNESAKKTRVELRNWEKETHTGPALTVFPDSKGSGTLRFELGPRGALTAIETLPPPEDGREPLFYREQNYMKERIVRHFLGTGDTLLPDQRGLNAPGRASRAMYGIPDFFNLAASLIRKKFRAEVAVLKVNPFSSSVLGDVPTAMVKTWLGPDEPLELALVPGSYLSKLANKRVPDRTDYYSPQDYAGIEYYALSGVDKNGRVAALPLSPAELYLTALPASLAAGKPFIKPVKRRHAEPASLHATVINALKELKEKAASRQAWEAGVWEQVKNLPVPRPVWRINLRSLSLQMVNTGVTGPAAYGQINESLLSAVNQTRIQGSGRLFSEYYSGKFRLDTGISADYGKTVLRPRGQPRLTTESVDQLVYESELLYRMHSFNGKLGPLVIGPYASAAYDTEFSRTEPLPLRKVLRGGAGLKLFEGAVIQELYAGLIAEQSYTYRPARNMFAVEAGFRLSAPLPGTALMLSADGTYRNFAASRFDTVYDLKQRLQLNLKLSTRLYGDIMLSPFVNYFMATGKKLPGSASNLTTGFALEYSKLFKIKK